jgi:hypothetical protein
MKSILIFFTAISALLCFSIMTEVNKLNVPLPSVYVNNSQNLPSSQNTTPHQLNSNIQFHYAQRIDAPTVAILSNDRIIFHITYTLVTQELPVNKFRKGVFLRYRPRDPTIV